MTCQRYEYFPASRGLSRRGKNERPLLAGNLNICLIINVLPDASSVTYLSGFWVEAMSYCCFVLANECIYQTRLANTRFTT